MYLNILNTCLSDKLYEHIYPQLIKIKYLLSFVYADVEKDLVANCFTIPDKVSLNSGLVAGIYNIPDLDIEFAHKQVFANLVNPSVHLNDKSLLDSTLYEIALRTVLIMVTPPMYELIIEEFKKLNLQYDTFFSKLFEHHEQDKSHFNSISFGLRK